METNSIKVNIGEKCKITTGKCGTTIEGPATVVVIKDEAVDVMKPYLPTAREVESMHKEEFLTWVCHASRILREREIERDPVTHFKRGISAILSDERITEIDKEYMVSRAIDNFFERDTQPR